MTNSSIMKITLFSLLLLLLFNVNTDASERKTNFNKNWKFHRGVVANAEQPEFNDNQWRLLNLPHDWSIEPAPKQIDGITIGPFSKMTEGGAGGADTGQTLGGEGWYRKEFTLDEKDRKSTRLNSSHVRISYAVFCLKKKKDINE